MTVFIGAAGEEEKILAGDRGSSYRLNQDVCWFLEDGLAQLLDFHRGQFYALDAVATLMVSLVLEKGVAEAVREVVQIYDTTEAQVRSDLAGLLEDLVRRKLLVEAGENPPSWREKLGSLASCLTLRGLRIASSLWRRLLNPQRTPNPLTVQLLLGLSWLSFRLLGWSRTLSLWQHWHWDGGAIGPDGRLEITQAVDGKVREAAASQLFFPVTCKERALVGYHLLRAFYGLPATLRVGLDRYPFQVHAWVECGGEILTDDAAHCQLFIPVLHYS